MRIRIDLKILIFLGIFWLTNQIQIYLTIMFFCVIHELGHIIMGLILKMKPKKLEIMPCGLSISFKANPNDLECKIKKGNLLELKKIFVAIAGPFVSLIMVILYLYFDPIYITKENAIYSNLLILLFNLIPLYPLDGGKIIKGILHMKFGTVQSEILIEKISNATMIFITVCSSIAVYYFKNIAIFLICLFLWGITLKEKNNKTLAIFE